MKTLVIEREAVKNNIGVIKERAGEAVIYAVLTGDGQGAGLVELARLLREEGIGRFAVSEPAEAAALRRAGFVEEEILMLRPTVDRAELEQLIDLNVVCAAEDRTHQHREEVTEEDHHEEVDEHQRAAGSKPVEVEKRNGRCVAHAENGKQPHPWRTCAALLN